MIMISLPVLCAWVSLQWIGFEMVTFGYAALLPREMTSTSSISGVYTHATSGKPALNTTSSCPSDISSGTFLFPHLIVPTSIESPDQSSGDSYFAYISPSNSTLFNFDVPNIPPYTGTCALVFQFPVKSELDKNAPPFYYSGIEQEVLGDGGLDFALLDGVASNDTTYNTTPPVAVDYGKLQVFPENNYTIATFPCQSGSAITYSATSINGTELDYFQDSAPSAIGLYIVPCN